MQNAESLKIFITGACGFVGKFLVEELLKHTSYHLFVNCSNSLVQIPKDRLINSSLDLSDTHAIKKFFSNNDIDVIVHLSAMARVAEGEANPNKALETNYLVTKQLIDISVQHEVKRFIFISSDLVRNFQSVVGVSKLLTEVKIQSRPSKQTKIITLRLPNISWTPGSVHLIFERLLHENKQITITHPDMSRRFITGEEAATYINHLISFGQDKDIFVINKPPDKIVNLAAQMISESEKTSEIIFIGMRPGEKLVEEVYAENEVKHTSFNDLALLKHNIPGIDMQTKAMKIIESKPGFTLLNIIGNSPK